MIELHRLKVDSFADAIDERLRSMVVAYRSIVHDGDADNLQVDFTSPLPYIRDSGKVISREKEITEWLEELDQELQQQRSVSGDGCYIDPKSGKIC